MSVVVAAIPPGVTLDAALAAMRGLGSCYPAESLSIGNGPDGGMRIIHNPSYTQNEPATRTTIALGVDNPGDLLAFAFSADDQQDGVKALCLFLIGMLESAGAPNYLTYTVEVPEVGRYAVTVQRCAGRTPAERIAELEQQLAEVAN